ncbi:uncharacterized protein LOC143959358 isoform X2 [Lithobates pipiens]
MAACEEKRDNMGVRGEHAERPEQSVNCAAKMKNSSAARVLSPYAKRIATQRQERKVSSNKNPGAISSASKAKVISRLPSHKPTCTSAPATVVRLPAGRKTATNPPLTVKQGACSMSLGVPRERQSAPLTQPRTQRQATYMMVPVRMKKAGLKLLDPEKVKNLTALAAAMPIESGEARLHSYLHQEHASKQRSLNSRPDTNLSTKQNKTSEDHESHLLLTHQIDGLVLSEKDGSESSSSNIGQETYDPQTSPQLITNQKLKSKHDETAWIDGSSIEETKNRDQLEMPTFQERILDINKDVKEEDFETKKKVEIQGQLLEGETESDYELHFSSKENLETEGLNPEVVSADLTQSQANALHNTQGEVSTKSQSQEDAISSHEHLKKSPRVKTSSQNITSKSPSANDAEGRDERCVPLPVQENLLAQKISVDFGQASNIADIGASSSQEDTKSHISSRRNDVIRRSQGVLVLTRSTEENAIFIPKLKFEFTPDNSIDWTALSQSTPDNQVKEKNPRITKPCTPRGPSFSKSVLKKSSAFQGYIPAAKGNSESTPGSFGAESSAKGNCPPLYGIVDLSISFQGKYQGDEIPKDIPKILLMKEDSDED